MRTSICFLLLVGALLAPVEANTSSGCASGMTLATLPNPTANLTHVATSIVCDRSTSPNTYSTYLRVDKTIEPLPTGDQARVYMQPANVVQISEQSDLLSFVQSNVYDASVDAGITIQFPPDDLTKVTTGNGNTRLLAAGFPNLLNINVDDGATVIIEDLVDKLYSIDVSCNGFCDVYITGNALIELSMSSGGNVYIKGRIAQGSYISAGNLWVEGVIEGLDANSLIGGRGIITTTSCANVEYREFFGSPCSVSSFTVTAPSNVACAAAPCDQSCTIENVQTVGFTSTSCRCISNCDAPTQSPSGAPASWSKVSVWMVAALMILCASKVM